MRTGDWAALLAANSGPAETRAVARRFGVALGWGAFGSALLLAVLLPVRADIASAMQAPMFWVKLAYPVSLAVAALLAAARLGQPGARLGLVPGVLALPLLAMWLFAAVVLARVPAGERLSLVLGSTWGTCPFNIALLSLPLLVATLWAMKGLAPTHSVLAGAAAGLLSGAFGAAVYALHCTEMQAPFLGTWYVLGMSIPTAAGALIGPRVLRW
jgi:hypothetical protein